MDAYLRFLRSKLGDALIVGPAAALVATDAEGRVLLARRSDDGRWNVPGGWVSPGESVTETALRELWEETGWRAEVTGLIGVYSDPREQTHVYPNGHQVQFVSIVFEGRLTTRDGGGDGESAEVGLFDRDRLPEDLSLPDLPALRDWLTAAARPVVR